MTEKATSFRFVVLSHVGLLRLFKIAKRENMLGGNNSNNGQHHLPSFRTRTALPPTQTNNNPELSGSAAVAMSTWTESRSNKVMSSFRASNTRF